jgi:NAD(P)-dependent dehydrogenase (short-subunit alcohol dehydrogenase family)
MATEDLRYDGQVALITGAGRGIGREHALLLASRGCKVIINDPGIAYDGGGSTQTKIADQLVEEIRSAGGDALANYDSVENGEAIIDASMSTYGRIDIVINNAGIVTPETWTELTLESWQKTINVNLTGVFSVMKAVWPTFIEQKYGRVVFTASPAIYGAGVAAYAASKAGVIGIANSLQFEAKKLKLDINCNTIIPQANTRMVKDLNSDINASRLAKGKSELKSAPQEILDQLGPEKVSAMAAWLSHKDCKYQAKVFEAGAGYFAQLNWARSTPLFATEKEGVIDAPKPENIREGQKILDNFMSGDMPNSGDGKMGAPSALERVFDHKRD